MPSTLPLFDQFQPTHYLPYNGATGEDFLYLTNQVDPVQQGLLVRFTEDDATITSTSELPDLLIGWVKIDSNEIQQYHDLLISMLSLPEAVRLLNNYLQP